MTTSWSLVSICCLSLILGTSTSNNDNVDAFILPSQSRHVLRTTYDAATLPEQDTVQQENQRELQSLDQGSESARLKKAKLLLEQFAVDDSEIDNGALPPPPAAAAVPRATTSAASPSSSKFSSAQRSQQQQITTTKNVGNNVQINMKETDGSSSSMVTVPETYWSNGLLDGSNVVTRYAFRRGIKVAEPLVKYDPIAAEKLLFKQPTKWIVRNVQIAGPLGLWAAGVVSDFLFSVTNNRRNRAKQLLQAISGLGPAIIKAGQALSSRPDLLPAEYLEELQKLQDDVPSFPNKVAFETVKDELGVDFNDVFELVQEEPIAAASIGQVYQARLRANGDLVAVKIQRPNCEDIISLDLYVLRWWSGIYTKIFTLLNRDINVQSIIDDFGELIYREIDYVAEAANAQRFNELYAAVTDVFVPKIYSDLTTRKVLVMEWVDGIRLTDSTSLSRYGLEKKKLVDTLVQCSLRQVLENGFFHADPHAGT